MVSQSSTQRDSPVDPLEGVSGDSGDADASPSLLDTDHPPCQPAVKSTTHKAAWVNPQGLQLQDVRPQGPAVRWRGGHFVSDATCPWGTSPSPPEDAVAETSLRKARVGSEGSAWPWSSDCASIAAFPLRCPPTPPPPSSGVPAASPGSEAGGAGSQPRRPTASTSEGAVRVRWRSRSSVSFSTEAFMLPVDIEKENAHFHAADTMISAMETVKWDLLCWRHTENCGREGAGGSPGDGQGDATGTFYTRGQESGSSESSDSGCEGCAVLQVSPVVKASAYGDAVQDAPDRDLDEFVILEPGEGGNPTEASAGPCSSEKGAIYEPNFNSAELIAKELYQVFWRCWMLPDTDNHLAVSLVAGSSVVVNEERVLRDFESRVDFGEEVNLQSRIRGNEDWEPPQFQVIVDVHPPPKRDLVVAAQNFLCAGCGTPVEPKFVKRLRYCEYLGRYFCHGCHAHAESCIPARILRAWDFRRYPVSNFSKCLLDSIWHQPLFNVWDAGHGPCARAKKLDAVREIQEQLFHIKKLLKTCRFAERALKAFEQVPRHLTEELHLFSLEDLVRVKKGLLVPTLKDILADSLAHVAGCELCQGKGFICEFCRSTTAIFPFQTATCTRCSECRACFHKQCFQAAQCPRCARITARKRLLESLPPAAT